MVARSHHVGESDEGRHQRIVRADRENDERRVGLGNAYGFAWPPSMPSRAHQPPCRHEVCSPFRKGGGLVDAADARIVRKKGKYPLRAAYRPRHAEARQARARSRPLAGSSRRARRMGRGRPAAVASTSTGRPRRRVPTVGWNCSPRRCGSSTPFSRSASHRRCQCSSTRSGIRSSPKRSPGTGTLVCAPSASGSVGSTARRTRS
jgi:hypothetical protein